MAETQPSSHPNIEPQYAHARLPDNPTQRIVIPMMLGFLIYLLSGPGAQQGLTNTIKRATPGMNAAPKASSAAQQSWISAGGAVGWGVTFFTLIVLADIQATENMAVGFAWLILLSIALTLGPSALSNLGNVQNAFGPRSNATNTTSTVPSNATDTRPASHPGRGGQTG